ncbi:MAG TPA: hypothetical protein DDW52_08320 [Planctomycetaceae bacterium]|nr:hypothetical protein [Planctomycetaceae bacterium]
MRADGPNAADLPAEYRRTAGPEDSKVLSKSIETGQTAWQAYACRPDCAPVASAGRKKWQIALGTLAMASATKRKLPRRWPTLRSEYRSQTTHQLESKEHGQAI